MFQPFILGLSSDSAYWWSDKKWKKTLKSIAFSHWMDSRIPCQLSQQFACILQGWRDMYCLYKGASIYLTLHRGDIATPLDLRLLLQVKILDTWWWQYKILIDESILLTTIIVIVWRIFHMRVTSYELQVTSCTLRVASCELRVTSCKLRVTGCELRVASYDLRVTNCELLFTSYELHFMNIKLRVTSCELHFNTLKSRVEN